MYDDDYSTCSGCLGSVDIPLDDGVNCLDSDDDDECGEYFMMSSYFVNDQCVADCTYYEGMTNGENTECVCDKYHFFDW